MKPAAIWLLLIAVLLAGCQGGLFPTSTPTSSPSLAPTAASTGLPQGLATATVPPGTGLAASGPVTLTIWLPPEFSETPGSRASQVLQARLEAFSAEQPGVQVRVRTKATSGAGSLLESLAATSAAAPGALPDLVAISSQDLDSAALKGLLVPFDGLTTVQDDADWYGFARQMGILQGSTYGLPFAADALVLATRTAKLKTLPADWPAVLSNEIPLAFPAADGRALFTLTLYQSAGGKIVDSQNRPTLSIEALSAALGLYRDGAAKGVFPERLADLESDDQAWQEYLDGRADLAVTWAARGLASLPADTSLAPLPAGMGSSLTLARGWMWGLTTTQPERRQLAAKLAEYLSANTFLASWNAAAGYLPTRPSALLGWKDSATQALFSPILLSAQAQPGSDLLSSLGPILKDATLQVIKSHTDPAQAAGQAAERVNRP